MDAQAHRARIHRCGRHEFAIGPYTEDGRWGYRVHMILAEGDGAGRLINEGQPAHAGPEEAVLAAKSWLVERYGPPEQGPPGERG